ncbi:transposase [Amycolatopsis acidicola]|uniref:Transposase n=1 Tax=Amycolatopsis acidicola TaxID=2596893 RepID=A0A5N0V689_9PSEU|nr:transposase [Amycolatopsis acidicola]
MNQGATRSTPGVRAPLFPVTRSRATARKSEPRQFTSWSFTNRVKEAGLMPSLGTVGDGYDNAMMESFWSKMQTELLDRKNWKIRTELANEIFQYFEIFHNRQRRHSKLGHLTPVEYERLHELQQPALDSTIAGPANRGNANVSGERGQAHAVCAVVAIRAKSSRRETMPSNARNRSSSPAASKSRIRRSCRHFARNWSCATNPASMASSTRGPVASSAPGLPWPRDSVTMTSVGLSNVLVR